MRADLESLVVQLEHLVAGQITGTPKVRPDDEKDRVQISPGKLWCSNSQIAFVTVVEGNQHRFGLEPGTFEVGELDGAVSSTDDRVELIAEIAGLDCMLDARGQR